MSVPISIDYINALCGSGKTYALVRHAGRLARLGRKVMIVQPTIALVEETIAKEVPNANLPVTPTAITSKQYPDRVTKKLEEHLLNPSPGGEVVFVTHSAFFGLSHFPNRQAWTLIVDEIPAVERHFALDIAETHGLLTPHLRPVDKSDHRYWLIKPKGGHLVEIAKNRLKDQVFNLFESFCRTVTSKNWMVYAHANNYQSLVEEGTCEKTPRRILASAIMSPEIFAYFEQVIIAGACFTESMLYKIWSRWDESRFDIEFNDITDKQDLRYRYHENGDLIDIHYAIEDPLSKNMRSKKAKLKNGEEDTLFEAIIDRARDLIGAEPVAEFFNADITAKLFENAERLPNFSHGLNSFRHIDNCVLLAAHNPAPAHFEFLQKFADIEPDEVHDALSRQNCYQALNRTSVRDPFNRNRKKVVVADLETASFLMRMFTSEDGARAPMCHHLDIFAANEEFGKPGRPRKYQNDAERSAAKREREAIHKAEVALRLARLDILENKVETSLKRLLIIAQAHDQMAEREVINLGSFTGDVGKFQGSVFSSLRDTNPFSLECSFDVLFDYMREESQKELVSKDQSLLISPAYFVSRADLDTIRGIGNIAFCRNVILDFDGGDLSPRALAAIFPELRIVAHSSWSHSRTKTRFRAIIPTDGIVDVEGYRVITDFAMKRLNANGYWSADEIRRNPKLKNSKTFRGVHGCDMGKLGPASCFYMPSLGANPADAFFEDYSGQGRSALVVRDWLRNAPTPEVLADEGVLKPPVIKPVSSTASAAMRRVVEALQERATRVFATAKQERIERAFTEWAHNNRDGCRDRGFCSLGVALRKAGCSEGETLQHLLAAANTSVDPSGFVSKAKRLNKMLYRTVSTSASKRGLGLAASP